MISEAILYGGAIYWLLLLFFCIVTSFYAERQTDITTPALWATATLVYSLGFTTYNPTTSGFLLGALAYIMFGAIFSTARWANLVYRISFFVKSLESHVDGLDIPRLAHEVFKPMNAPQTMILPPDPFEFRTRITCWFLFWPAFTIFSCFVSASKWTKTKLWNFFYDLSKSLYK